MLERESWWYWPFTFVKNIHFLCEPFQQFKNSRIDTIIYLNQKYHLYKASMFHQSLKCLGNTDPKISKKREGYSKLQNFYFSNTTRVRISRSIAIEESLFVNLGMYITEKATNSWPNCKLQNLHYGVSAYCVNVISHR